MHRLALDAKIIPQLVAALEGDAVITGGWLPSLIAVTGLLRDLSGVHVAVRYVQHVQYVQ
jgi:hypothetical protein